MKPILTAVLALSVAACASERDICISKAQSDLQMMEQLAAQTRANVARGFAIGERKIPITVEERCEVRQPDGSTIVQVCPVVTTETETFPVAIDLDAEAAKLRSLERRVERLRASTSRAVAQCKATYPAN